MIDYNGRRFRGLANTDNGEVSNEETATFLRNYMTEFRDHVERVLTVLPRARDRELLD